MDNMNLPQIKHPPAFPAAVAAFAAGVRLTLSHPAWLWAGVKLSALVLLGGLIPALLLSALLVWGLLWADVPQKIWGSWSGWWDVLLLGLWVFPLTLVVWRALVEEITESAQAALAREVVQTLDPAYVPPPAPPGPGILGAILGGLGDIARAVGVGLGLVLLGFVPLIGPILALVGAGWFSADALARVWLEALAEARHLPPSTAYTLHAQRRLFWNLLAFFTLAAAVLLNVLGGVALAVGVVAATAAHLKGEVPG